MGSAVLVLAAGWSAGVALGPYLALPALFVVAGAVTALAGTALAPSVSLRLLGVGLLALLLGQGRLLLPDNHASPESLAAFAGDVLVRGRVVEAPIPRGGRYEAVVEVEGIAAGNPATADPPAVRSGTELARPAPAFQVPSGPPARLLLRASVLQAEYGDRIETWGRLARPRSRPGWPLEELLARRGIHWVVDAPGARVIAPGGPSPTRLLARVREAFEANTRAVVPEPQASLVSGIVFGARASLPPDLRAAMAATGTSHLTAVSGANVALVAGALTLLAIRVVGRTPASIVAMVGVWLFTLLVGAPPSALRAAMMATFTLAAQAFGRQSDAVVGLAVAAALLLAWDPGLAHDVGFQLSVSATAGLILLSPTIDGWLGRLPGRSGRLPASVRGQVAIAVAAQVATLPIVVWTFQRISLVSLPANVLAAPTIVPIMGFGTALAFLGRLPGFDVALGWGAWLCASLLLAIVEGAAALPGAVLAVGRPPGWLPLVWYLALGCWVAAGSADARALGLGPGTLRPLMAASLGGTLALAVVGWPGDARPAGTTVALLDVEPAAAFVRTPDGRTLVLTTAAPGQGIGPGIGGQLELWERALDVVVGPDGIAAAVDLLAIGGAPPPLATAVEAGARIDVGGGVVVQVVDARTAGERPVLDLALYVGGVAVLLPGPGTPGTRWSDLEPDGATVAVLPASAVSWARAMPPRHWLLLVGEPALERARGDASVPFLTRRDHGAVELSVSDGGVAVRTERCASGRDCLLELQPAVFQSLVPRPTASSSATPPKPDADPYHEAGADDFERS